MNLHVKVEATGAGSIYGLILSNYFVLFTIKRPLSSEQAPPTI